MEAPSSVQPGAILVPDRAGSLKNWALVGTPTVLPGNVTSRLERVRAQVSVVYEEALGAAIEGKVEAGYGRIRNRPEAGSQFAVDGADLAIKSDVDLAV